MRLDRFQRLALVTTASTYLLIMVGGLVRAAGAGLGCPDWPRCFGRWIPPTRADQLPAGFDPEQFVAALTWLEYVNRLLGVLIGFLIVATLVVAIRDYRHHARVWISVLAATLLVGFQGWLGGQVVKSGLADWMITAHLVVALIIVGLLLYATALAFFPVETPPRPSGRRRGMALAGWGLSALALVQIGVGTQLRAEIEHGLDAAADAGEQLARAEWMGLAGQVLHSHRELAALTLLLSLLLLVWTLMKERGQRVLLLSGMGIFPLALIQILIGKTLSEGGFPAWAQVAHLGFASIYLGATMLYALLAVRLPD